MPYCWEVLVTFKYEHNLFVPNCPITEINNTNLKKKLGEILTCRQIDSAPEDQKTLSLLRWMDQSRPHAGQR